MASPAPGTPLADLAEREKTIRELRAYWRQLQLDMARNGSVPQDRPGGGWLMGPNPYTCPGLMYAWPQCIPCSAAVALELAMVTPTLLPGCPAVNAGGDSNADDIVAAVLGLLAAAAEIGGEFAGGTGGAILDGIAAGLEAGSDIAAALD